MSSKLAVIISSYTVSKLVHFFLRQSVLRVNSRIVKLQVMLYFSYHTTQLNVRLNDICSSLYTHLRATGSHLPYGIKQCYLALDTGEHSAKAATHIGELVGS